MPTGMRTAAHHPPVAAEATGRATPRRKRPWTAADHPGTLTAPLVGVAYLAPQPGAAPFVRVGDTISKGQTLLIIEAMKVMNQIRALARRTPRAHLRRRMPTRSSTARR